MSRDHILWLQHSRKESSGKSQTTNSRNLQEKVKTKKKKSQHGEDWKSEQPGGPKQWESYIQFLVTADMIHYAVSSVQKASAARESQPAEPEIVSLSQPAVKKLGKFAKFKILLLAVALHSDNAWEWNANAPSPATSVSNFRGFAFQSAFFSLSLSLLCQRGPPVS